MGLWHPLATRDVMSDAGPFVGGPFRGILHSTEGSTYAGARAAYVSNRSSPHFTAALEPTGFRAWQHIPLNRAARALVNLSGGVETNRLSAIQIEVVARAVNPAWPEPLVVGVRDLMIWVEGETGIKPVAPPFKAYVPGAPPGQTSYGATNGVRMTPAAWQSFNGWCGHLHCPENLHGDPGLIDIAALLRRDIVVPPVEPPLTDLRSHIMANAPVLQQGATGHSVRLLQALLTVHASDLVGDCRTFVDGDFGPTTARVLSSWQARTTITARGVADAATWLWLIGV